MIISILFGFLGYLIAGSAILLVFDHILMKYAPFFNDGRGMGSDYHNMFIRIIWLVYLPWTVGRVTSCYLLHRNTQKIQTSFVNLIQKQIINDDKELTQLVNDIVEEAKTEERLNLELDHFVMSLEENGGDI